MRKYAYLAKLEELLAPLPAQERQDALNYYEEYFDAAGSENEEKTAEELGDPAEVARKVLEEEGIDPQKEAAAGETEPQPPDTSVTQPGNGTTQIPAPPALADPEHNFTGNVEADGDKPKKKIRRFWLIFGLLIVLALGILLSVLLFGNSESGAAASVAESMATAGVAGELTADGAVTHSGMLEDPQDGTLVVTMTRGNVTFQTGDRAWVEVRNVDVNNEVSYGKSAGHGYTFSCESTDPNTHVTITLPAHAYDRLEVRIANSGAIELGDLQIRQIDAFTASGPIQAGCLQTSELNVQTAIGNIWMENISDGSGYQARDIRLHAPNGSVAASFGAARDQWKTDITAPKGVVEAYDASEEETSPDRFLQVVAANTVNLQYGVKG